MPARDVLLIVLALCMFAIGSISIIMWMRADQKVEELEREVIMGKLAINAMGRYMEAMGCPLPALESKDLESAVIATLEEASA